MVFSSGIFLFLFLPLLLSAYYLTPRRFKNALLLAASILFYWWGERRFTVVIPALIGVNYVAALAAERWPPNAGP